MVPGTRLAWGSGVSTARISAPREVVSLAPESPSTSLRAVLWIGVVVTLFLGLGTFIVTVYRVVALSDARVDARTQLHTAHRAALQRWDEIRDLDRSRQPHIGDGPATQVELQRARQRDLQLGGLVRTASPDDTSLAAAVIALDDAVAAWQASPPAPSAKEDRLLERVRTRHLAVIERLGGIERALLTGFDERIRGTVAVAGMMMMLVGLLSITLVVWVLRRTATPLEQLARLAATRAPFPVPGATGIREVDVLAGALHQLDVAVRDHEQRLASAHREAIELTRFGERVQQALDERELHQLLGDHLREISGALACQTLVQAPDGERLELARNDLVDAGRLQLPIASEPMRCRALRTLRAVTADVGTAAACRCPLAEVGGSYLCAPMLATGTTVGVVALQADGRGAFASDVRRRVQAALAFGAPALASMRLLVATQERALRDPLTGAFNRSFLAESLDQRLAAAARRHGQIGVIMVDLDHFKQLNDTHGHAVGDRALIAAVAALQAGVRRGDAVVRVGGEELVVVLDDCTVSGALETAERLRVAVERIQLESDRGDVHVRASLGVAVAPDHGTDRPSLLDAADRALYRAKRDGRNTVRCARRRGARTTLSAAS